MINILKYYTEKRKRKKKEEGEKSFICDKKTTFIENKEYAFIYILNFPSINST